MKKRSEKLLPQGDYHPSKGSRPTRRFIGAAVDESTYRALRRAAKAQDRSVSSLLRQILSPGDNHPLR
jgi:hypothetical protein